MAVSMRQSTRMGWYLFRQRLAQAREVPADRRARAAVPVQPRVLGLRQDPAPRARPAPAHARRAGGRRDRGERRADGLDRRRRAAHPPRDPRDRRRARQAQEVRLPVHERAAAREEARELQARAPTSRGRSTSTACASATTSRSSARASSTRRSPRSGRPRRPASASRRTRRSSRTTRPRPCARCSTSSTTSCEVDEMMISPAYAYEKAPDQEHFLGVQQTRELFSEAFARRAAQALAPEPQPAVPRLPRRQGRIRLHRLGDPQLLAVRLAAPLLPDVRRLRADLPGAARDDRLERYGRGKDPRCENCMAHCGYEPTAVLQTTRSLRQSLRRACVLARRA